jgi:hypothetical protein
MTRAFNKSSFRYNRKKQKDQYAQIPSGRIGILVWRLVILATSNTAKPWITLPTAFSMMKSISDPA